MTFTCEINKKIPDFLADVKSLGIIHLQTIPGQVILESAKDTNAQLVDGETMETQMLENSVVRLKSKGWASSTSGTYRTHLKPNYELNPVPCTTKTVEHLLTGVKRELGTSQNFDKRIFYTNQRRNSVTCCDIDMNNIICTYRDTSVLKDLRGIAVDNEGNVYIVSYSQNKLVLLSAHGQQHRQLLSEKDGLLKPYAICYDKNKQTSSVNF
ncbi:unnamed protein product [Mytilus edulis]|uniref:Uncharacterized protein n=1 Tax=Mytilus edulis TaxID=6550 RepID=A0A8S3V1H1_MYTED|nr:unnamed protein product [Mytilus edulis]